MPAFWPVLHSLGLYQDPEASTYPAQRAESETSGIYRQYTRLGRDEGEGRDQEGLTYVLENLGFILHPEKKVTTRTQEINFLGMIVDTQTMELRLPGQKITKLRQESARTKNQADKPTGRDV
uniref:Uncharacterized protein n=1 Tax=Amphimedon queenslandica TaxID=400682 RepID=A0A1X7VA40_AMPQE